MTHYTFAILFATLTLATNDQVFGQSSLPSTDGLVGSWQMVSAKYGGRVMPLKDVLSFRHVTPTHLVWLRIDPATKSIKSMACATWSLSDDNFSSKVLYAAGRPGEHVKRESHQFKCEIDGGLWYHSGKLASGLPIEEVFKPVTPKKDGKMLAKHDGASKIKLEGSWQLESVKVDNVSESLEWISMKHLTPTHYIWFRADTKSRTIFYAGSGTWELEDGKYLERLMYGRARKINPEPVVISYHTAVDGNSWVKGSLQSGKTRELVYRKVQPIKTTSRQEKDETAN